MTRSERLKKLWQSPTFRKKQKESIKNRRPWGSVKKSKEEKTAEREERKARRMLIASGRKKRKNNFQSDVKIQPINIVPEVTIRCELCKKICRDDEWTLSDHRVAKKICFDCAH